MIQASGAPVVRDCHVCHGKGAVNVRLHGEDGKPFGRVRPITCPECNGRASWLSRDLRPAGMTSTNTPSTLREKTK